MVRETVAGAVGSPRATQPVVCWDLPVGGRLAAFAGNWGNWQTDLFVRSVLSQG